MIKRLLLKNFGPFESVDIPLGLFTVILGGNGTGKSMLFSALRAIGRVARHPLRSTKGTYAGFQTRTGHVSLDQLLYHGDRQRILRMLVEFETPTVTGTYDVSLAAGHGPGGVIVAESLSVTMDGQSHRFSATENGEVETTIPDIGESKLKTPRFESIPAVLFRSREGEDLGRRVQQALWTGVGVFRLDPTSLKSPAVVGRALSPTGYNFAAHLDEIRNAPGGREAFDEVMKRFRMVAPHVEDILLPAVETGEDLSPRKKIALVTSAEKLVVAADLESDGTMLLLAYASLLYGRNEYETLCIEEPENGVHPRVIPGLTTMLRGLTTPPKAAQVLICTHSLKLFEEVERRDPSVFRLVRRSKDRSTVESVSTGQITSLPGWAGLT